MILNKFNKHPERWGVFYDACLGPWLSLGVHVDFGAPHVALHVGWWIVTIGYQYRSDWDKTGHWGRR